MELIMQFLDVELIENLFTVLLATMLVSIVNRGIKLNKGEKIMMYKALVFGVIVTISNIISLINR